MRRRIIIIILIGISLSSCRTYTRITSSLFIANDNLIQLQKVSSFIDLKSHKPLDTISVNIGRINSDNYDYYIKNEFKSYDKPNKGLDKSSLGMGVSNIYDKNNRFITRIKGTQPMDAYIWLNDYLLIYNSKPVCIVQLSTGRKKYFRSRDQFWYLGKYNDEYYFENKSENTKLNGQKIKLKGSIISIKQGKIKIINDTPNDTIINLFHSPNVLINYTINKKYYTVYSNNYRFNIDYSKVFNAFQVFQDKERFYLLANDRHLYLLNDEIKLLKDLYEINKSLRDFNYKVEDNFLILMGYAKVKLNNSNKSLINPEERYLFFVIYDMNKNKAYYPYIKQ